MSNIVIISKYTTQQHIVKTRFHYLAYFLYALQLLILLYIIISRRVFFFILNQKTTLLFYDYQLEQIKVCQCTLWNEKAEEVILPCTKEECVGEAATCNDKRQVLGLYSPPFQLPKDWQITWGILAYLSEKIT